MARQQRVREVRTGGGGRILAFILGILMGIILLVGALGGAAYYVWNKPVKKTVNLIDKLAGSNVYSMLFDESKGYLDPSYADKKVGTLIKDVTSTIGTLSKGGDGTLNDLQAISPKVGWAVEKLVDAVDDYGVPVTKEEMMEKSVDELPKYLSTQVKETALGDLLEEMYAEGMTEPLLLALCYGQEGIDYTKNAQGEIEMRDGAKKTTLDDLLRDGGITEVMDKVALESVSSEFNKDDAIMRAIAYGSASRYTVTKDGEGKITDVTMNQITFTFDEGKLYDIDGEEAEGTFNSANKTLVEGETTYYLKQIADTPITYEAYLDAAFTKKALYSKTTINTLMGDASSLVDGLYLTDAMAIDGTSHEILISLAYGEEGVDYIRNGNEIVCINNPRTIADLKENSSELIDGILLIDALGITDESNPVLRSIAYDDEGNPVSLGYLSENGDELIEGILLADAIGVTPDMHPVLKSIIVEGTEGVDYQIVDDGNGGYEIQPMPDKTLELRTLKDLSDNSDGIIGGILLTDALKIDENSHPVLRAIAYDENGDPVSLNKLSEDSDTIIGNIRLVDALSINPDTHPVLKSIMIEGVYGEDYELVDDGNGGYTVQEVPGRTVTYRTLDELSNESDAIINGILVADALSVTPESDKLLITLAYGKEGKDYKLEGGKIVMLGNSQPRTLSDLSGDMGAVLDDIALADVIDPAYDTPMIMYMLYGREDIHYTVVGGVGEESVVMLQQRVAIRDGKVYNPYGEEIVGTLNTTAKTFTVDGVTYKYKDASAETMTNTAPLRLADGTTVPYSYLYIDENGNDVPVYYEAISIGDLSSEEGEENHLSLATQRMTVKEILGGTDADDNFLLRHVENYTIDELPTAIENLRFTDVYARDIYKTQKVGEDWHFVTKDGGVTPYNVDEKLTDEQKADLVVTSTWWYLLHNDAECHDSNCPDGAGCSLYYDDDPRTVCVAPRRCQINFCGWEAEACHAEHCHLDDACAYKTGGECTELTDCSRKGCIHDYKITDFDALVANMTDNMQDATLLCLDLDGVINLDENTLETELQEDISIDILGQIVTVPIAALPPRANGGTKRLLYELTINEIFTYAGDVLAAIGNLQDAINQQLGVVGG